MLLKRTPQFFTALAWVAALLLLALSSPRGLATTNAMVVSETKKERLYFSVAPEFLCIQSGAQNLCATGLGASVSYALDEPFMLTLGFRQGFNANEGLQAIFTSFEVGVAYAPYGNFPRKQQSVRLAGKEVVQLRDSIPTGLRIQGQVVQYFFNLSSSVVPLPGIGAMVWYDWALGDSLVIGTGARADLLFRSGSALIPISGFARFTFGP